MKQSKRFFDGWNIVLVFLAGSLVVYALFRFIKKRTQERAQEQTLEADIEENNPSERERILEGYKRIKEGLSEMGVSDENFTRLVVAQASFESDRFKSEVFTGNYNAFGMRQPSVRDTTSIGDLNKDGYANYNSLQESAKDYVLWTRYNHLPETYEDTSYPTIQKFVGALKSKGYFEDTLTHYIKGVNATMGELISILNQG